MVADDKPNIDLHCAVPSQALKLPFLQQTPEELRLKLDGRSPISSRNSVPRSVLETALTSESRLR